MPAAPIKFVWGVGDYIPNAEVWILGITGATVYDKKFTIRYVCCGLEQEVSYKRLSDKIRRNETRCKSCGSKRATKTRTSAIYKKRVKKSDPHIEYPIDVFHKHFPIRKDLIGKHIPWYDRSSCDYA